MRTHNELCYDKILQIISEFPEVIMATPAAQTYLTPEEYIALERKARPDSEIVKSKYINGEIIAMSGASFAHKR